MKNTLVRLICLMLAIAMVFTIAGCGKKAKSNDFDASGDDFDLTLDGGEDADDDSESTDSGKGVNTIKDDGNQKAVEATTISNPDSLSLKDLMAQVPSELKGKTINVYSWNNKKEVTGAEKVISNFEKASGIKVKWTVGGYEDYDSKIAAMINSGNSPDLIRYRGPNVHRASLCQDIKSATGFDFSGDIWDSRVMKQFTFKNKVYGINLKNTLVNQPFVILYRKSVIEKNKLEDPYTLWKNGSWTWDAMLSVCKAYKKNNTSGYPFMAYNHSDLTMLRGDNIISFDGNSYKNNVSDSKVFADLKEMCDLRADNITSAAMRQESYFTDGSTLFMLFNSIALRTTNAHLKELKADDDLFAVPIPTMDSKGYEFAELEAYGVPKKASNGACVYFFLRYYLDADNYNKDEYFCNSQALEVYNYCMSQPTVTYDQTGDLIDIVSSGGSVAGLSDWIRQGGAAAQLKQELDTISPTIDLAVKKGNEVLNSDSFK